MGSNFFEGKGDYIVYGSHTGQSNNTLTQYSSEQDADITSKLGTNNNLSQYLYNPKNHKPTWRFFKPSLSPARTRFKEITNWTKI
jgi:hypothetical protein